MLVKDKQGLPQSLPVQYRSVPLEIRVLEREEGEADDSPRKYELAVSSEYEVQRWWGAEVLDHEKKAVRMDRLKDGAALMLNHREHIGVVLRAWMDNEDKKIRAVVAFSPNNPTARMVEADVAHPMRFRRHVSVGYAIHRAEKVETTKGGIEKWRITDWEPMEVTIADVPADPTVGLGREATGEITYPVTIEGGVTAVEVRSMVDVKPEVATKDAAPGEINLSSRDVDEIVAMAEANKCSHRLGEWLSKKMNVAEVGLAILKERQTKGDPTSHVSDVVAGFPEKEIREFSYVRAIAGALAMKENRPGFDGIEREVHDEISKTVPFGVHRGGVYVPQRISKRALDSKSLSKGAELVTETAGELIELLRNRAVVMNFGARVLSGLNAPIAFPKQSGGMTVYWVGENPAVTVTPSDLTLGLSLLAPKNLMGAGAYSRQLMILGNRDVEAMVRDELSIAHGLAFDKAAIHGIGAAGQPNGAYFSTGVNVVNFGAAVPTFGKLIDMQTAVAQQNADLGTLGYITTPGMAGKLRQTLIAASAGSDMIWSGTMRDGIIAGYKAAATNQVSSTMLNDAETGGVQHGIVFANWADLIIGLFSALELIVDPFTAAGQAMVKVTSFQMGDTLIRHGGSFTKSNGATIV